jgi:hypothetical protein
MTNPQLILMDQGKHRSYNEKEIGALIQRATELHEEAIGTSERSLSLEEIESPWLWTLQESLGHLQACVP